MTSTENQQPIANSAPPHRTGLGPNARREERAAYLFLLPWVVGLVAFTLMAGFGFGEYLAEQVWLWPLVAVCLAGVVGAVLPSTTRALQAGVSSADRPRPPGGPRRWLGRLGRSERTP